MEEKLCAGYIIGLLVDLHKRASFVNETSVGGIINLYVRYICIDTLHCYYYLSLIVVIIVDLLSDTVVHFFANFEKDRSACNRIRAYNLMTLMDFRYVLCVLHARDNRVILRADS